MTDRSHSIAEAAQKLAEAQAAYESAHQASEIARSRATSRLNDLNEAQKTFDKIVKEIKSESPRETDWYRQTPRATPMTMPA